jgi:RNA polymerase sigma-70 factor (sigma-E family)
MSVTEPGEGWAVAQSVAPKQAVVDITYLYANYRLPMVRMAVLLVDDLATAEDVVQDAFAAMHQRSRSLRDPHAAVGYLRVSVVNGCRSALRKRKVRREHPDMADPGTSPGADRDVLVAEEHRYVLAALRTLPRRQQEVLLLRYWSDLSEAEIASTLGIAVGTVKSAASRGLDRLETLLGEDR